MKFEEIIKLLNETPNSWEFKDRKKVTYNSHDAYPFFFFDNVIYVGEKRDKHGNLLKSVRDKNKEIYDKISEKLIDNMSKGMDVEKSLHQAVNYSGRFWPEFNIVSFWEDTKPPKYIVAEIAKHFKVDKKEIKIQILDAPKFYEDFLSIDDMPEN